MPPTSRHHRQTLLPPIGEHGQARLARSSVLVVGVGALGSAVSELLVRMGVGRLTLVDRDVVETTNLHRQLLYDEADARRGLAKVEAARDRLRRIDASTRLDVQAIDLDAANVLGVVREAAPDVIVDGTDNAETRYLLNDVSVRLGIPWVMGAALGLEGRAMAIDPRTGPCLRCVWPVAPSAGELATCETAGVLPSLVTMVASLQVTETLKLLLDDPTRCQSLFVLDGWSLRSRQLDLRDAKRADCATCGSRVFEFLGSTGTASAKLCGRNAVQVRPNQPTRLDLASLAGRLATIGVVEPTELMLKFAPSERPDLSATIFRDGRMLLFGTEDRTLARTLYARWIGA